MSPAATGACIPNTPAKDSQKVTVYTLVNGVVGTNGVGFCVISPSLANDNMCIYTSNAAYTGNFSNSPAIRPDNVSQWDASRIMQNPYTTADLTTMIPGASVPLKRANASGRIVAAGATFQYTGTVMNMGGTLYALTQPNHSTLNQFHGPNWSSTHGCYINRVSARPAAISICGMDDHELVYPDAQAAAYDQGKCVAPYNDSLVYEGADTGSYAPVMGFLVTGLPGNTFQVRYVQHAEYIGPVTQAFHTKTHADVVGFTTVNAAAQRMPEKQAANPQAPPENLMFDAIKEIAREAAPVAASMLRGAASSYLQSRRPGRSRITY